MDPESYCADPCWASSLPFWKTKRFAVPADVTVLRDDAFPAPGLDGADTRYFKMIHRLKGLTPRAVPEGFSLRSAGAEELAAHISRCYRDERISPGELEAYKQRSVYCAELWLAVVEDRTGDIAASGIAELDASIGEGILEWIQVSPEYRRRGLGRFLVNELLLRLGSRAAFVTVSGRLDSESRPLALYRSCGFENPVVWHVVAGRA